MTTLTDSIAAANAAAAYIVSRETKVPAKQLKTDLVTLIGLYDAASAPLSSTAVFDGVRYEPSSHNPRVGS
jgi:hypothetical protein